MNKEWIEVTDDMRNDMNPDFPLIETKMQIKWRDSIYDAYLMIEGLIRGRYQYGWYNRIGTWENGQAVRITGIQDNRVTAWRYV